MGGSAQDLKGFPKELRERYEPRAILGQGAFGKVYQAWDGGRLVAVKVVHGFPDEEIRHRFFREAAILDNVRHPHLLEYLAHGESDGRPFLVTECVQGASLEDQPGLADPLERMLEVGGALEAVHAANLLHRDIKPANVMIEGGKRAVLIDLGLVYDPQRTRLTETGVLLGTLAYMAPELLLGGEYGPTTDWYAWAASLFYLHERRFPYPAKEILALAQGDAELSAVRFERLDRASREAVLLEAMLGSDPDRRPASLEEIQEVLAGPAIQPAKPDPIAAVPEPSRRVEPPPAPPAHRAAQVAGGTMRIAAPVAALVFAVMVYVGFRSTQTTRGEPGAVSFPSVLVPTSQVAVEVGEPVEEGVAFDQPRGRLGIVIGGVLRIHDLRDGSLIRRVRPSTTVVRGWALSGLESFAGVTAEGELAVFSAGDGRLLRGLSGWSPRLAKARVTATGSYLEAVAPDGAVWVWDLREFAPVVSGLATGGVGRPIAIAEAGGVAAVAESGPWVRLVGLADGLDRSRRPLPRPWSSLALDSAGRTLVGRGEDEFAEVMDLASGLTRRWILRGLPARAPLAFLGDRADLLAVREDGALGVYRVGEAQPWLQLKAGRGVREFHSSRSGRFLALLDGGPMVEVWQFPLEAGHSESSQ